MNFYIFQLFKNVYVNQEKNVMIQKYITAVRCDYIVLSLVANNSYRRASLSSTVIFRMW